MSLMENLQNYARIDVTCYPFTFMSTPPPPQPTDKVVFPNYVLDTISKQNPEFQTPILFELRNPKNNKRIVCGVHSFESPDYTYLPQWMFDFLQLREGDNIPIIKTAVPKGKSVTFKPLQSTFYNIDDPKRKLEAILRNYMTLTVHTAITFQMNCNVDGLQLATDVSVEIVDLQPYTSVLIRETELNVEFEENKAIAPVYEKPKTPMSEDEGEDDEDFTFDNGAIPEIKEEQEDDFHSFSGNGNRLGKSYDLSKSNEMKQAPTTKPCPHCGSQVSAQNYQLHVIRCAKMYKLCPICGKKLLLNSDTIDKHMELHEIVRCVQCGKEIEKQYLKDHLENVCPKRLGKCEFCTLMFPIDELQRHKNFCGNTMEQCDLCGATVALKNMEHHKTVDCAFAPRNTQPQTNTFANIDFNNIGDIGNILNGAAAAVSNAAFECPICMLPFDKEVELNTHMQIYHPELYD
ncbi:Ubiquitin fusion degRadation protein [Entamoeba marina]